MRGQWDGIAGFDDLIEFFKRLPNPDKQFAVMPGISHASFQQKNYMLVYHILLELLLAAGADLSGVRTHEAESRLRVRKREKTARPKPGGVMTLRGALLKNAKTSPTLRHHLTAAAGSICWR